MFALMAILFDHKTVQYFRFLQSNNKSYCALVYSDLKRLQILKFKSLTEVFEFQFLYLINKKKKFFKALLL